MRNLFRRWLLPLFLFATINANNRLFGQSPTTNPQESSALTLRSRVSEVRLVFFATDQNGHPVESLQKDDFAVVDNERVIREFRSMMRSQLIKLDVIVLMDSSESVLPRFPEELADVLQLISQSPWGSGDNVSVLSFSGMEEHLTCVRNCRKAFRVDQVASMPRGGATPLFDAVESATALLVQRRQPDVWPVIVLFSDGDDTISRTSFRHMLESALANEVEIYSVNVSKPGRPSNGYAALQTIADESGGRFVQMGQGAQRIFDDIIADLHSAYVVTYVPRASSSDFHSLRILPTHNLKLQFRCRRGYYLDVAGAQSEDRP
jgi:VWFA-related protein